MKKTLIITVILTLIFCIGILSIPKNELPTEQQWQEFLEWEEENLLASTSL